MNKTFNPVKGLLISSVLVSGLALTANVSADGADIYSQTCVACHGADGKGALPGTPDFTDKHGRLSQEDTILLDHMEHGFQSPGSFMAMPPKGGNSSLTRHDLEDVLKYIRTTFGG
ncbi:MAG: cytochrome c [Gammaproteobacteria bacterium]|nr:cytochrome c [Gammaproteobacteria bacterium]